MNSAMYSTVVVEDEELIRNGLVRKIEQSRPCFSVVGEAAQGVEALELIRRLQPQLLITDIRMPVMDGLKLIEEVHNYFPRTAVIIASGYADFEYARQAMKFNVKHYLLKPFKLLELSDMLDDVRAQLSLEPLVEANDSEKTVQRIQHYLRGHYHEDISLEHLAKQFNFSSAYLSKIFLKHAGEAPSKYIAALRINEAKRLLKHRKDLPVKTVGEQVGYPDPFYFSRIFKQATGVTPRDYQK
ncbi:response regulator transcription factor [Cohnella fermenti]|uniref:Response regulator n=1 Tax=Cohnella fermenti TaxID=2565925 RepID=A0A4S4BVK4_9BACL|nr:response regulator [Cohnella fermenti]THF79134.1 response regulator [Cohnella fermenti]